jgi:hypothetical protein
MPSQTVSSGPIIGSTGSERTGRWLPSSPATRGKSASVTNISFEAQPISTNRLGIVW